MTSRHETDTKTVFAQKATVRSRLLLQHPPAGTSTLIVSLGLITTPWKLGIVLASIILLVFLAILINRLAGIQYPLWNPLPFRIEEEIVDQAKQFAHENTEDVPE